MSLRIDQTLLYAGVIFSHLAVMGSAAEVDYGRDVRAIFKERCWACHGALKQKGDLRLDTVAGMTQGGVSGPAVVPAQPGDSPLWQRISSQDPAERMPPEGMALSPEQLARIEAWITQGAVGPADEVPEADPRSHWAFQPPVRPPLPAGGSTHPIDALLESALAREGLTPAGPADKSTLLRRVYLDLIGLPPDPGELRAFLADDSADAYEKVVDRLLKDPRHGERWGRHWLDIWRYSDWYGRRHVPDCWNSAPQIWRWRDWVVTSLNADVGYDQMLRLMLAADEIAPDDPSAAVATGYLIRNWYALNPNDWMRNTVEHTGKAFLGLTFNCAHCHDHKYDPISHDDYFRMRAFFEPMSIRQDRVPGQTDPGMFQEYQYGVLRKIERNGAVRIFDKNPKAPTWFYTGGDERNRVVDRGSILPGVPSVLGDVPSAIEPVAISPRGHYPGLQPTLLESLRGDVRGQVVAAQTELEKLGDTLPAPDPALVQGVQAAEAAYAALQQTAVESGRAGALEGAQSLLLDATTGRRILEQGLKSLTALTDGMTFEFIVELQTDAHFNCQLAKDVVQGLTAGCVVFDHGKIQSYQPGGTSEFQVGSYDFAAGQRRFRVSFQFDITQDRAYLTVVDEPNGKRLVEAVPVALNGWNPVGSAVMGISFDARTGSVVVLDGVRLRPAAPAGGNPPDPIVSYDFEGPVYAVDEDVVGREGWKLSSFSQSPATSVVSAVAFNAELKGAWSTVKQARRSLRASQLPRLAATAKLQAAQSAVTALEARIAAELAKYQLVPGKVVPGADLPALAREASLREREGAAQQAEAGLLAAELSLAKADGKPAEDANRAKEIQTAQAALTAAEVAATKARTALADDTLAETYSPLSPVYPASSTGRRTALANWLVRRDHPLTARVAVNHVWGWHFHQPLVSTVYDFGRNGAPPSHPELLDFLAIEFMESGWSFRHLHRLIVTSQAYRRSSSPRDQPTNVERDPDNRRLWRMPVGRMEVEVVRDSLIAIGGKLDPTQGGQELENETSLTTYRRSLYYSSHPEAGGKSQFGELFDAPDANDCYRRSETIIPQQALALTNSQLIHSMSAAVVALAPPVPDAQGEIDLPGFVNVAFERVLCRAPTAVEQEACLAFLKAQLDLLTREQNPEPRHRACESLIRVLFNHNDFVTIR
jgi:mono/diheme cytochrome c family protein